MERFTRTELWQSSLAARDNDEFFHEREELRSAFFHLRERVTHLVGEMPREMRDFTVHDVTHLDALWEMADLIAGPGYLITPTEGFVLGAAFLLHDAGMGLASYPKGLNDLQRDPRWRDTAALLLRDRLGRAPTATETEPDRLQRENPAISERATVEVLRHRHAEQAEKLLLQKWPTPDGKTYQLLNDSELAEIYGALIGRIALSHWWPMELVRRELEAPRGAPGRYPREWSVDPLKVACLLRVADASHLDDRRAPSFLRALRSPKAGSQEHWVFQNKLLQPRLVASG